MLLKWNNSHEFSDTRIDGNIVHLFARKNRKRRPATGGATSALTDGAQ